MPFWPRPTWESLSLDQLQIDGRCGHLDGSQATSRPAQMAHVIRTRMNNNDMKKLKEKLQDFGATRAVKHLRKRVKYCVGGDHRVIWKFVWY